MTSTVASRRETAAALLFGASKESQEAAAQRDLGPHLRKNLGVLARLPETIRDRAVAAIIAATMVLLQFDVIELLDEADYAKASTAGTGAARELPATSSEPETVRIDAFSSAEEGTRTQPT